MESQQTVEETDLDQVQAEALVPARTQMDTESQQTVHKLTYLCRPGGRPGRMPQPRTVSGSAPDKPWRRTSQMTSMRYQTWSTRLGIATSTPGNNFKRQQLLI